MFKAKEFLEANPVQRLVGEGMYLVQVEDATLKTTFKSDPMVTLKIRIIDSKDGWYRNALHWENLVLEHANEDVVLRAKQKLAEISLACGIEEFEHPSELNGGLATMEVRRSRQGNLYQVFSSAARFHGTEQAATETTEQATETMDDWLEETSDEIPFDLTA